MRKANRLISLLLSICTVLSLIVIPSHASEIIGDNGGGGVGGGSGTGTFSSSQQGYRMYIVDENGTIRLQNVRTTSATSPSVLVRSGSAPTACSTAQAIRWCYKTHNDVKEIIRILQAEGKTIMLTSHNYEDLESLCHQIFVLEDGKLGVLSGEEMKQRFRG